jgi:hypothetical protein
LQIVPNTTIASSDAALPPARAQEAVLSAENDSLRLLLQQAGIDANTLLVQAGIDAKEREAWLDLQLSFLPGNRDSTLN